MTWTDPVVETREHSSEGSVFQEEGPTVERALCCLMAMRSRGTTKSPLEAEWRDCQPEQVEVRMKRCSRRMPRTQCQTNDGSPQGMCCQTGTWRRLTADWLKSVTEFYAMDLLVTCMVLRQILLWLYPVYISGQLLQQLTELFAFVFTIWFCFLLLISRRSKSPGNRPPDELAQHFRSV